MSDDPTGVTGGAAPPVAPIGVGVLYRCVWPPELLPDFACLVEGSGFDQLWQEEER